MDKEFESTCCNPNGPQQGLPRIVEDATLAARVDTLQAEVEVLRARLERMQTSQEELLWVLASQKQGEVTPRTTPRTSPGATPRTSRAMSHSEFSRDPKIALRQMGARMHQRADFHLALEKSAAQERQRSMAKDDSDPPVHGKVLKAVEGSGEG